MSESETRVPLSDQVINLILAVLAFSLVFNLVYSMQRGFRGGESFPMWILLIAICLVGKLMRNHKLLVYFGLLACAVGIHYLQFKSGPPKTDFVIFTQLLLVVLIYGLGLLIFILFLFARLDKLAADYAVVETDVKGLGEESGKLSKQIDKSLREVKDREPEKEKEHSLTPVSTYSLYRRALVDVVGLRTRKDIPSYLARTLSEGFGIEKGLIIELAGETGTGVVREAWGDGIPRATAAVAALKVPPGLVRMAIEKLGAVLQAELTNDGPHQAAVNQMENNGMKPISLFPLITYPMQDGELSDFGNAAFVLVACEDAAARTDDADTPAPGGLRILPIQIVLDVAGRFLSRIEGGGSR